MKTSSGDPRPAGSGSESSVTPAGCLSGGHGAHPIVLAGLLVGVLDLCAAFALSGARGGAPARVLQGIASGVLGPAAFTGSGVTAALGLLLHFLIALGAAAVFYLASRWWTLLLRRPIVSGILYGVVVHAVMSQAVLPLSHVQIRAPSWSSTAIMVAIHVLFVGLPISLTVARMGRRSPAGARRSPDLASD